VEQLSCHDHGLAHSCTWPPHCQVHRVRGVLRRQGDAAISDLREALEGRDCRQPQARHDFEPWSVGTHAVASAGPPLRHTPLHLPHSAWPSRHHHPSHVCAVAPCARLLQPSLGRSQDGEQPRHLPRQEPQPRLQDVDGVLPQREQEDAVSTRLRFWPWWCRIHR